MTSIGDSAGRVGRVRRAERLGEDDPPAPDRRHLRAHRGRLEVGGSVGSLLELGAGFHPDFTGRENIYLSASIYGLRASSWTRLDDIVAFSELEEFIDIPVRTYSSGMYMRLGFAIAVHIEADVLLLDEVFAVGDEAFQRKCIDRVLQFRGAEARSASCRTMRPPSSASARRVFADAGPSSTTARRTRR